MSCSDQPYYLWAFSWQAFNGDGWFNPQALLIGFSSRWLVTQTHTPPLTPSPWGIADPPTACSLKKASKRCTYTASSPPPSWTYPYVNWSVTPGSSLLFGICGVRMQQRMQKPMQIKARQRRRHLGDDRRRPDGKRPRPLCSGCLLTAISLQRVFWCSF